MMTERERAAFIYGFGIGMKCVNPGTAAFNAAVASMFNDDRFLPLILQMKPEVERRLEQYAFDTSEKRNQN